MGFNSNLRTGTKTGGRSVWAGSCAAEGTETSWKNPGRGAGKPKDGGFTSVSHDRLRIVVESGNVVFLTSDLLSKSIV